MNLTQNRIEAIVSRYARLKDLVEQCLETYDDGNRRSATNIIIDRYGNITYEKNTACHCHPEYETFDLPKEVFGKWLEENKEYVKSL